MKDVNVEELKAGKEGSIDPDAVYKNAHKIMANNGIPATVSEPFLYNFRNFLRDNKTYVAIYSVIIIALVILFVLYYKNQGDSVKAKLLKKLIIATLVTGSVVALVHVVRTVLIKADPTKFRDNAESFSKMIKK